MPRCIYYQQERSTAYYTKVEHVLPQSFGSFRQNMTLRNTVCDLCNQYFGDKLEIFLGRDTFEGQLRFVHGVKSAEKFKTVGQESRIVIKSTEGDFEGCYLERYYSSEQHKIVVKPLPQVGFMLAAQDTYQYYLLDQIPTKAELDEQGYQQAHPLPIIGLEVDPDELKDRLAKRGISFRYRGPVQRRARPDTLGVNLEGVIDHVIFRCIAKIAFNYLAYWEGTDFVQQRGFDRARRYIRWQHAPGYELLRINEKAVLEDEPVEGMRRLGHLLTVNWAADGVSLLAQVSLFNWMTYHICLAPDFTGPPPKLTRGHFFNVSTQEILELGSRSLSEVK